MKYEPLGEEGQNKPLAFHNEHDDSHRKVSCRESECISDYEIKHSDAGNKNIVAIRKLSRVFIIAFLFMVGEFIGGYISNSLAIISDSAHLLSDVAGYGISLVALYLGAQTSSKHLTYGYSRVEVIGALLSILILWVVLGILLFEGIQRLKNPEKVEGQLMLIVASVGLLVNIVMGAILIAGGHSHSHGLQQCQGHGSHQEHSHSHGNNAHHGHKKKETHTKKHSLNNDFHGHEHGDHEHGHHGCGHVQAHQSDGHGCGHGHSHPQSHGHGLHVVSNNNGIELANDLEENHREENHSHGHGHQGHNHGHNGHNCNQNGHSHDHNHHGHDHRHKPEKEPQPHNTENINVHVAFVHVVADALQSFGVVVSSAFIWYDEKKFEIADPLCTIIFASLGLFFTISPIREILSIFLMQVPSNIDTEALLEDIKLSDENIHKIHCFHVWSVGPGDPVLTCHVEVGQSFSQANSNKLLEKIQNTCSRHGISHTTCQIEQIDQTLMGSEV